MRGSPQVVPNDKVPAGLLDDDFLSDLDQAFERIQMVNSEPEKKVSRKKAKKVEKDLEAMRKTYLSLAQVHLRPVLRYLKAIQMGVSSKDLCEIVHYVVGPLVGKTRKVGLVDQTKALIAFQRNLKKTIAAKSKVITKEQQEALSQTFSEVQKGFELEFRGHSTAVVNLLGYYKALRKNKEVEEGDFKKLFAVGIPSISMLRKSSITDLVSLSGIGPEKISSFRKTAREFNILSLL